MPSYNVDQMPYVTSSVERFLVNPDGNADGMILVNGVEVYFAPHLSTAVLTAIQVGDRITVYGVLPMASWLTVCANWKLTNQDMSRGRQFDPSPGPTLRDIESDHTGHCPRDIQ